MKLAYRFQLAIRFAALRTVVQSDLGRDPDRVLRALSQLCLYGHGTNLHPDHAAFRHLLRTTQSYYYY